MSKTPSAKGGANRTEILNRTAARRVTGWQPRAQSPRSTAHQPTQALDPVGHGDEDLELMEALRRDDPTALQRLVDRYWDRLLKYVVRLLEDIDAAEDIVQEAFVRLWEERARWWTPSIPQAILYRIVRNLALNEMKAHGFRQRQLELRRSGGATTPDTPIQLVECEELRQAVTRAISALPPRRREVFVLARFHGLTYREIAGVLDIAPQTVANQMASALATLQRALSPLLKTAGGPHGSRQVR